MNARRWGNSEEIHAMLNALFEHKTGEAEPDLHLFQEVCGERRLGLFAVACCRRLWSLLPCPSIRHLVETVEQYLDGIVSEHTLGEAVSRACEQLYEREEELSRRQEQACESAEILLIQVTGHSLALYGDIRSGEECYEDLVHCLQGLRVAAAGQRSATGMRKEAGQQSHLLRDLFGNPFRPPPAIDLTWLTWNNGTVKQLAQEAYEHRQLPSGHLEHGCLAVLADALEEAGCDDAVMLSHLRGPGPHVRGCWCVDLLTGRQ